MLSVICLVEESLDMDGTEDKYSSLPTNKRNKKKKHKSHQEQSSNPDAHLVEDNSSSLPSKSKRKKHKKHRALGEEPSLGKLYFRNQFPVEQFTLSVYDRPKLSLRVLGRPLSNVICLCLCCSCRW